MTLRHGPKHHLYRDVFDSDAVFLEIEGCAFEALPNRITIRIPYPVWEHVRSAAGADFTLAEMSGSEFEEHMEKEWRAYCQRQADSSSAFGRMLGSEIWAGESHEERLANGRQWFINEREKQRLLKDEVAQLRASDRATKAEG